MTDLEQFEHLSMLERKASKQANDMRAAYALETDPEIATRMLNEYIRLSDQASAAMNEIVKTSGHQLTQFKQKRKATYGINFNLSFNNLRYA